MMNRWQPVLHNPPFRFLFLQDLSDFFFIFFCVIDPLNDGTKGETPSSESKGTNIEREKLISESKQQQRFLVRAKILISATFNRAITKTDEIMVSVKKVNMSYLKLNGVSHLLCFSDLTWNIETINLKWIIRKVKNMFFDSKNSNYLSIVNFYRDEKNISIIIE